jgi:hypothetical protein
MPSATLRSSELALGWDVEIAGPYTLAVDDVATTLLTPESTLQEVEMALNRTSHLVGLTVAGEPASSIQVVSDKPAVLTGDGATVIITDPFIDDVPPTKQEAIDLAYDTLVKHRNQDFSAWPAPVIQTEAAIAALSPYQTVDEATAELAQVRQKVTAKAR